MAHPTHSSDTHSSNTHREGAALHPVVARVCEAATFATAGDLVAAQLAEVIKLLHQLLHPIRDQRALADVSSFPLLYAAAADKLSVCPSKL